MRSVEEMAREREELRLKLIQIGMTNVPSHDMGGFEVAVRLNTQKIEVMRRMQEVEREIEAYISGRAKEEGKIDQIIAKLEGAK